MDPHTYAQARAMQRLRDQRKRSEYNAIMVIRELIEDDGISIDAAVNGVATVYQLGLIQRGRIMDEAVKRYAKPIP